MKRPPFPCVCLAFGIALFAVVPLSRAAAAPPLPEEILSALPASQQARLPQGHYRLVHAWEAERPENHLTGRAVADPGASGAQAWEARPQDPANRHLIFGPYLDTPPGHYVAFFRLRRLEDCEDDLTATLDACVGQVKTLAVQEVWTGDLARDRYVQIPLTFSSPGGRLECRVFWNGYAGLRVDRVALYALEGLPAGAEPWRAPSAAPSGKPNDLPYPEEARSFAGLFPRAPQPDKRQLAFDLRSQSADRQLLLLSLQGLVNRERPTLHAILDETDRQWLDWLKHLGWVERVETVDDPMSLVDRYRDRLRGVIIYDPRLSSTRNVGMMLASVKDALPASPQLARALGLPILEDLRGRWRTHAEAYRWAFATLWPQLNHSVLACLHPGQSTGLRDYLYQHRIFTFWITGPIDGALPGGDPTAEALALEQILARTPANIPVLGFPWAGDGIGIGEGGGVRLFAEFGKFLVGAVGVSNLSVHSGFPAPELRQKRPPAPPLQPGKVYLTWLMSDGDNLPVLSRGNFPGLWRSPERGRVPVAWSLSPCAALLIPGIAHWYFTQASPNDVFVGAVSGVGYTYPDDYGQRFEPSARARLLGDFLRLTREALPASGLRQIWIMGASDPGTIRRYAAEIPGLNAIFPDYGKRMDRYDELFYPSARGVPVFHACTHWEEGATRTRKIELLLDQVRAATPRERPAFLHGFIWNWGADLSLLPEVMERLGPEYAAVAPDHLAELARQSLARQQVRLLCPPEVVAIAGHPVRFPVQALNATDTGLTFHARITGGLTASGAAPSQGSLPPHEARKILLHGEPAGSELRLALSGPWGEHVRALELQIIPASELAGPLPARASLRFADRFPAWGLSHRSGEALADPSAPGGRVWSAVAARTAPGHIVFGPYKPVPKGRYLALFRLKRTGEPASGTDGDWARIDVHAPGSSRDSANRALAIADCPLQAWRAFPLEFNHSGGPLETRIFWPGHASLSASEIVLWELVPDPGEDSPSSSSSAPD